MKNLFGATFGLILAAPAVAGPLDQPHYMLNDFWTYHNIDEKAGKRLETHDQFTISRVGSDSIVIDIKPAGAEHATREMIYGADWSRLRSVNGEEMVVNRPLLFPLAVGKSWKVEINENNPAPQQLRSMTSFPYKVIAWEDVTVPAGTFHALKIEADGRWTAEIANRVINNALVQRSGPAVASSVTEQNLVLGRRVSGRIYKCFWYAPEVKRWVKSIEEDFSAEGVRNQRFTSELESYGHDGDKPATAPKSAEPTPPTINKDTL